MTKDLHDLTDLQLAIMAEVWKRRTATVTDVYDALLAKTGLAKKTIGTLMSRLEKQGLLVHEVDRREYLYSVTVKKEDVERAKVSNILQRLFRGDIAALVSHALQAKDVKSGDVERIRELLAVWDDAPNKGTKR